MTDEVYHQYMVKVASSTQTHIHRDPEETRLATATGTL